MSNGQRNAFGVQSDNYSLSRGKHWLIFRIFKTRAHTIPKQPDTLPPARGRRKRIVAGYPVVCQIVGFEVSVGQAYLAAMPVSDWTV
jgi:hypothetical protein